MQHVSPPAPRFYIELPHDEFTGFDGIMEVLDDELYLYAPDVLQPLLVADFHVVCEPLESFDPRELRAQRRVAKKARTLDRRSARAAKRSQFAI